MTDPVNHPAHYTEHPSGIECIQITEHMGFNLGNAVKYIWRADLKGSAIEDLEKARWYIDRELTKRDHIDAEVVGADVPDFAPGGVVIPEGGRVLTAEQVEDVRALVWLDGRRNFDAFYRLRALFPATEPAEPAASEGVNCGANSVVLGWCKLTARHEGLHTNGTYLWGTPSEPDPPAPAEPAEEETKAERDSQGIIRINGGRIVALSRDPRELVQQWYDLAEPGSKWQRDYAAALDLFDREATSSPVVPAPTETGPWQTWQEVPEGVKYYGINGWGPTYYVNRGGVRYRVFDDTPSKTADYVVQNFAPFVAAEEG